MKHLLSKVFVLVLLLGLPTQGVVAQIQPKRCEAITRKGTRCKNHAINKTKYCRVHQAYDPSVPQCKAITKMGTRCSRAAKTAGYCYQHYEMKQAGRLLQSVDSKK